MQFSTQIQLISTQAQELSMYSEIMTRTILRREPQFTSSPLCATARAPWAVWTTNGWQLTSSDAALVE